VRFWGQLEVVDLWKEVEGLLEQLQKEMEQEDLWLIFEAMELQQESSMQLERMKLVLQKPSMDLWNLVFFVWEKVDSWMGQGRCSLDQLEEVVEKLELLIEELELILLVEKEEILQENQQVLQGDQQILQENQQVLQENHQVLLEDQQVLVEHRKQESKLNAGEEGPILTGMFLFDWAVEAARLSFVVHPELI
jgi:hypothetical protein